MGMRTVIFLFYYLISDKSLLIIKVTILHKNEAHFTSSEAHFKFMNSFSKINFGLQIAK